VLLEAAAGIRTRRFQRSARHRAYLCAKHGYAIAPNRELVALGVANVVAGLVQGIPLGVIASASAVNERAGASSRLVVGDGRRTRRADALVPDAAGGGAPADSAGRHRSSTRSTGWPTSARCSATFVSGAASFRSQSRLPVCWRSVCCAGVVLAMAANIVMLLRRLAVPGCTVMGRLPGTGTYVDIAHHAEAERVPGLLLLRMDGLMFFANIDALRERLRSLIREAVPAPRAVILDCEVLFEIDIAGLDLLGQLTRELAAAGIELTLAGVHPNLRELLDRSGVAASVARSVSSTTPEMPWPTAAPK